MKTKLAIVLILAFSGVARAECNLDSIAASLAASLDTMKPTERDVTDIQSTDGGIWQIYREKDGRLNTIIRTDFGESGRGETRLGVVNRQTYGIAQSRIDYLRHAFIEQGPNGDARRTTDYFYYCGGKAFMPNPDVTIIDVAAYRKNAAEAQKTMLGGKDVADVTKGLVRR